MAPRLPADLEERFESLRSLGSGGRGDVVLVRSRRDGRECALKIVTSGDAETFRMFRQEAALLARLNHPNLIRIEEYFDGPPPAYTMPYVPGLPLDKALKEKSWDEVLEIFAGCCLGLHYLHVRGLLHRDLKPANILVSADGEPKLLDFGLPGFGTPAYWPPEAKAGRYGAQSDLYGLGLCFRESLEGRSGEPDFFRDLLVRLTEDDPSRRPTSALSLLRFLNRHVKTPFSPTSEQALEAALTKPPWVTRPEERAFQNLERICRLIVVDGPTGVGRSRFTDEIAWRRELSGKRTDVTGDLHRMAEAELRALQVSVRARLRKPRPEADHLILLEYDSDLASATLLAWIEGLMSRGDAERISLEDLPRESALELVRRATEDHPLADQAAREIAQASGGRPLLLIEGLRQKLLSPGESALPKTLDATCRARVGRLGPTAREFLSLLAATPGGFGDWEELSRVWDRSAEEFADALLSLRAEGLVSDKEKEGRLSLAHPGLLKSYRAAFDSSDPSALAQGRRRWIVTLSKAHPAPVSSPEAPRIVRYALEAGDTETARAWSAGAVDFLFKAGRFEELVELADELLPFCTEREERFILLAHRASSLYRVGRFEDSIRSFDEWFAAKGDDETQVETIKHRLYTGQALLAKGDLPAAKARLLEALNTGDHDRHLALRAYHARALAVLASLCEQSESPHWQEEAEGYLRAAHPLLDRTSPLKADLENQRGLLEQSRGRYAEARARFTEAAQAAADAKQPQTEAIAWNNLAMLDRERGEFGQALTSIDRALQLARLGQETLQIARYRQNRALVLKDLANFPEAFSEMEASDDILAVYGGEDDRRRSEHHKRGLEELTLNAAGWELTEAELEGRDGPRFRALAAFRKLEIAGAESPESDLAETIAAVAALDSPLLRADLFARLSENMKRWGLEGLSNRLAKKARAEVRSLYEKLPEEMRWNRTKTAA